MSQALTAFDCVGNTAQYLQSVPVSTENERKMAEMWHKMYVECGSKYDPITANLLCEGVCTCCNGNSDNCILAKRMFDINELVRITCAASLCVLTMLPQLKQYRNSLESEFHNPNKHLVGDNNCPRCMTSLSKQVEPDCKVCGGTGIWKCPLIQKIIDRALYTFMLAAVCCTGHTINIKTGKPCLATADDILFMLDHFSTSEFGLNNLNDGSHPLFVMSVVKEKLLKVSAPIILPAFRPIICKFAFSV